MKNLRKLAILGAAVIGTYAIAYLVSAHRFVGYSVSSPIYDPDWSMTVDLHPTYRFFNFQFWMPIHAIDRKLRPDYWTYTVRADIPPSEMLSVNNVFINVPSRPIINQIFPTICDIQ